MNAGRLGLLSVGLMVSLTACNLFGGSGPRISSFSANPSTIMSGQSSELSWELADAATSISISGGSSAIGDVTNDADNRVTVTPTTTTTYTLTARNAEGTSTKTAVVTVSGDGTDSGGPPIDPGDPTSAPEGSFGVSTSATGPFENDADGIVSGDDDERIIDVSAPSTFYAQVDYSDPDGIASIDIVLQNGSPMGLRGPLSSTPRGGFTVGEPTGCDLSASPTAVTCVYPITVAAGTVDISELEGAGSEFAYVFRANVTDGAGNSVLGQERGYVNIQ